MLGSLILYLKGMRIMMFQLSGFYCMVYAYVSKSAFARQPSINLGPQCVGHVLLDDLQPESVASVLLSIRLMAKILHDPL